MQCIYRLCTAKNFATQLECLTISKGFIKKKKKTISKGAIQDSIPLTSNYQYKLCNMFTGYNLLYNSNIITYADVFKNLEDVDNFLDWSLQV